MKKFLQISSVLCFLIPVIGGTRSFFAIIGNKATPFDYPIMMCGIAVLLYELIAIVFSFKRKKHISKQDDDTNEG